MAKNRVQPGKVMDYTNNTGSTILSGSPIIIGTMVGVALVDILDGESGSVAIEEVWVLPKLGGNAFAQGAIAYLTPGGSITPTESGNTYAGKVFKAAASGDLEIQIKLNA